VSFAVINHAF